jgi:hypothetical protein
MIEEPTFKVDFHTSTGHTVTITYTAAGIRSHPHPYVKAAAESGDREGLWQALERMLMWTFEPEANGRDRPTRIVDDEGRVWVVRSGGVVAVTITEQGGAERRQDIGFGPPTT